MPKATISTESVRKELKSCEGGFVELKRMTYGQWLHRQDITLDMKFKAQKGKDAEGDVIMANRRVAEYEFTQCLVDHNLEDDAGQLLDFRKPYALDLLDPRIGEEIGKYIDELHSFEDDLGNSPSGSVGQ